MEHCRQLSAPNQILREPSTPSASKSVRVAFSYNASCRHVTEQYLSDTFAPGDATHFDLDLFRANVSVLQLLDVARSSGVTPDVFAHLVHTPGIPRDLHIAPVPTASLDIDSFAWTPSRVRWAQLFDYVFVWHLSLVPIYRASGHPQVIPLAHAVDARLFSVDGNGTERSLDLGWVGGFGYGQYAARRRIIEGLAVRFRMNDFRKKYSKEETAEIYQDSRIVVNVSRSDFPPEANMRCYEAMAGGALLITGMPSELTEWGFREGEHFVGWRDEQEIPALVDYYLRHAKQRTEIGRAGQQVTLRDFTFQKCRNKMAAVFQQHPNQFFAPARNWREEDVALVYLEYYYRYQLLEAALAEFATLRRASGKGYLKGLPMMLKTLRHGLKPLV
jgi:hypothetical protein